MLTQLKDTGWPKHIPYGRGNIAEILPGWPTVRGILSWAVKMDELHAVGHIYIHNFAVLSLMLNSQRYEILEAHDCTDPTAPLDLQWKVSLFLHSTFHYWSLKMQAIHIGSYPGQCDVYLMPVINIGPWEMCILSTLIFEILQSSTESCPSLCTIIHYGGGPWPPTKINQSPVCHFAKTWWISYPLWVSLR